jgi:hypothetical protein
MRWPRMYRSSAVLLPNGAVFVAGGQAAGVAEADQWTYEIFQPPYFHDPTRPVITAGPATLPYFSAATFATPDASRITKVRLIRTGAATHSFDQNQRMRELPFVILNSTTVKVTAPANGHVAPPGYYMVFLCADLPGAGEVNRGGLPSVGHMLRVENQPTY